MKRASTLLELAGLAAITAGTSLFSIAAGLIVGGVALFALGLNLERG